MGQRLTSDSFRLDILMKTIFASFRFLNPFVIALLAPLTVATAAETKKTEVIHDLKIGDGAPDFSLPGIDGKTHTLREYAKAVKRQIGILT